MEFDIFGNAIIDSRSLTRIKIDELWDRYCGLFGVCFSLDDFALAEEDMLNLISRSIEENQDYLSNFALSNNQNEDEREKLIYDVASGDSTELLEKAYNDLGLFNFNLEEQYMILKMIYGYIKNDEEKMSTSFSTLMSELKQKDVSELLEVANEFQWWPAEITELRKIRYNLLHNEKNKNIVDEHTVDDIKKKLERIYRLIQVTNYKYIRREKVLNEYNILQNDIKKVCDSLSKNYFLETPDKTEEVSENGLIFGKDGFSEITTFEMKPFSEIKN